MDELAAESSGQIDALRKAVMRIAWAWKLRDSELGAILGLSGETIAQLRDGAAQLDRSSKSFEAALYLVRLFAGLGSFLSGDDAAARTWLETANEDLGSAPRDRLDTLPGLIEVCDYVDFHRQRS